jgi:hypothetical protein
MTVNFAGVQAGKYLVQITGEQMIESILTIIALFLIGACVGVGVIIAEAR